MHRGLQTCGRLVLIICQILSDFCTRFTEKNFLKCSSQENQHHPKRNAWRATYIVKVIKSDKSTHICHISVDGFSGHWSVVVQLSHEEVSFYSQNVVMRIHQIKSTPPAVFTYGGGT